MKQKNVIVFDGGNSLVKWKTKSREGWYPHAIAEITEAKYRQALALSQDQKPVDFIKVNGGYYVVGADAEEYGVSVQRQNQARYRADYFGVLLASAIGRAYKSDVAVEVFASHPPGHVEYIDSLLDSLIGDYAIEIAGRQMKADVYFANVFDEPTGGYMNVALNSDGNGYTSTEFKGKRFLIVDVGGGTSDFVVVREDGTINYTTARSEPHGINEALESFRSSFIRRYRSHFQDTDRVPPERIRQAFETGVFVGGGRDFDCAEDADRARNSLINVILRSYISMGGGMAYDGILFTGGGSGLIFNHIRPQLNNNNAHLADSTDAIHLANVRGGLKLWKLYNSVAV